MAAWWNAPGEYTHWEPIQERMFDSLAAGNQDAMQDTELAQMVDDALFSGLRGAERDHAQSELERYLWQEYEINFNDEMDWEAWREWYEGG